MKRLKHIIALILALGLAFLVLVALDEAEKMTAIEKAATKEGTEKKLRPVTIIEVSRTSSYAIIQSLGEVKPRWKTTIKAKRRGEILTLSKALEAGKNIKKGEVLFIFDNSHYETQLAEAQNQIAQADLLIQSEKEQARLVRQDWKILRKKGQPSAFMLRIPQIKAAQTQFKLAKTHFNEVRKRSTYSKILAPYNGIVVSHSANVGDIVESGQTLAEVFSSSALEVSVKLNEQQWSHLRKKWRGQSVDVLATVMNKSPQMPMKWEAIIARGGESIDLKTRQRTLYLTLNSSQKPTVGSFVRIEIRGKKLRNLLEVPRSALTPQGVLWLVDDDNKLQQLKTSTLFSNKHSIFVKAPPSATNDKNYSIVVSPLSSFLAGIEVLPKKD